MMNAVRGRKRSNLIASTSADKLNLEIDLADQLAHVMVSAQGIEGNPRLIKRFLNNLVIRNELAKAQNINIGFDQLVKLLLFERCASKNAFEYLVKQVVESDDGKVEVIKEIEETLATGNTPDMPEASWDVPFIHDWLKLNPRLGDVDLRPLLYLSRNRSLSLASFDELSPEGRALLEGILEADTIMAPIVARLKKLGEQEAERILSRIRQRARSQQWDYKLLIQALHVPKAFPALCPRYINMLDEIPAQKRAAPLIPLIREEGWAKELLNRWSVDEESPSTVRKAIKDLEGGK